MKLSPDCKGGDILPMQLVCRPVMTRRTLLTAAPGAILSADRKSRSHFA
jgi:hypothetical protein